VINGSIIIRRIFQARDAASSVDNYSKSAKTVLYAGTISHDTQAYAWIVSINSRYERNIRESVVRDVVNLFLCDGPRGSGRNVSSTPIQTCFGVA
jgi:hypothetical protein